MASDDQERHRHFILEGVTETEAFRSPGGGVRSEIPHRDRIQHGGSLQRQIQNLRHESESVMLEQHRVELDEGLGLQVEFERPIESLDEFRARINVAARDEAKGHSDHPDPAWLIGPQNRHRGSLHGDIWCGTAADLASRGHIGVYPAPGWW